MFNPVEAYRSAKERVNPDGLIVSGTLSGTSFAVLPLLNSGLTFAIHELGKDANPDIVKIATIGALAVSNTIRHLL